MMSTAQVQLDARDACACPPPNSFTASQAPRLALRLEYRKGGPNPRAPSLSLRDGPIRLWGRTGDWLPELCRPQEGIGAGGANASQPSEAAASRSAGVCRMSVGARPPRAREG